MSPLTKPATLLAMSLEKLINYVFLRITYGSEKLVYSAVEKGSTQVVVQFEEPGHGLSHTNKYIHIHTQLIYCSQMNTKSTFLGL